MTGFQFLNLLITNKRASLVIIFIALIALASTILSVLIWPNAIGFLRKQGIPDNIAFYSIPVFVLSSFIIFVAFAELLRRLVVRLLDRFSDKKLEKVRANAFRDSIRNIIPNLPAEQKNILTGLLKGCVKLELSESGVLYLENSGFIERTTAIPAGAVTT